MKVLVACEFSGVVRDAFLVEGHDAISCDLLPTESPGPHIQGDVRKVLLEPWDLVVAHPPCNYLSNYITSFRPVERFDDWDSRVSKAADLFLACLNANAPKVAVENPSVMNRWARGYGLPKPSQTTDFSHYGDPVRKRVGLWLIGLPPLMATLIIPDAKHILRERGTRRDGRKASRHGLFADSKSRSRFYPGIATAMAKQWGNYA